MAAVIEGNGPDASSIVSDAPVSSYPTVHEGSATILFASPKDVFYNPVQQFNRDLSVLAIRAWSQKWLLNESERLERRLIKKSAGKQTNKEYTPSTDNGREAHTSSEDSSHPKFNILEALSATGLRAIRYAKEIPHLRHVVANDLSANAVQQIQRNVEHNGVADRVKTNHADARAFLYANKEPFHVIDLDPYGSATPFMDSAAQAIEDGGLLLVTCTDLAVLAGDCHPEKCFSQYGGTILKQCEFCHEQALRLVLHMIASACARYGKAIVPLLSLSIDFYVRIFVRVEHSPRQVKDLLSKTMMTFQCSGCRSFVNQPLGYLKQGQREGLVRHTTASLSVGSGCEHCGSSLHIGGPMYGGLLHDPDYIDTILQLGAGEEAKADTVIRTLPRLKGMLTLAREELTTPHYWSLARMSKVLHSQLPPQAIFKSAILNAGYRVSETHTGPGTFKTDAPGEYLWDIMRAWILQHPIREASILPNTPGASILTRREPRKAVNFDLHPDASNMRKEKLVRYPLNPTVNWGPKSAAKNTNKNTDSIKKRKHDQVLK
jgi:tRNA (guanine26-N2/guanine27-N2)-dimethyltransferase